MFLPRQDGVEEQRLRARLQPVRRHQRVAPRRLPQLRGAVVRRRGLQPEQEVLHPLI